MPKETITKLFERSDHVVMLKQRESRGLQYFCHNGKITSKNSVHVIYEQVIYQSNSQMKVNSSHNMGRDASGTLHEGHSNTLFHNSTDTK